MRNHAPAIHAISEADELYLSVVVLGELRAGFHKGSKLQRNEDLLAEFLAGPRVQVLPIDEETSHGYGLIHEHLRRRGTQISPNDLWIAATALQHGLRILTTDRHFLQISQVFVDCIDPI